MLHKPVARYFSFHSCSAGTGLDMRSSEGSKYPLCAILRIQLQLRSSYLAHRMQCPNHLDAAHHACFKCSSSALIQQVYLIYEHQGNLRMLCQDLLQFMPLIQSTAPLCMYLASLSWTASLCRHLASGPWTDNQLQTERKLGKYKD